MKQPPTNLLEHSVPMFDLILLCYMITNTNSCPLG